MKRLNRDSTYDIYGDTGIQVGRVKAPRCQRHRPRSSSTKPYDETCYDNNTLPSRLRVVHFGSFCNSHVSYPFINTNTYSVHSTYSRDSLHSPFLPIFHPTQEAIEYFLKIFIASWYCSWNEKFHGARQYIFTVTIKTIVKATEKINSCVYREASGKSRIAGASARTRFMPFA